MSSGVRRISAELEIPKHELHEQLVEIVAAEMGVAARREHLEHAILDLQDRDVEGSAAEVVDSDRAAILLVEAVGQRRGGRLADDAQHFEARQSTRVARGGALRVIEVGRHGDHRAIHFEVELALFLEELLGAMLQLAKDECGNLRRREFPIGDTDAHDAAGLAADAEWQQRRLVLHVVYPAAHEALHRVHGTLGGDQQLPLRLAPDVNRALLADGDDRRDEAIP